jgi:hypothetical protein
VALLNLAGEAGQRRTTTSPSDPRPRGRKTNQTPASLRDQKNREIFILSTLDHRECSSFDGGCLVCEEYCWRALKVQELWHAKALKLNIPLSAKGQPVGQRGAFTGIAIDSYKGRFSMLPDKMAQLVAAWQEFVASEVSTPQLFARVRGNPFIAVVTPSLSQLIHGRETGVGPLEVPSMDVGLGWGRSEAIRNIYSDFQSPAASRAQSWRRLRRE